MSELKRFPSSGYMNAFIFSLCIFACTLQVVWGTLYDNRNMTDCHSAGFRCSQWSSCKFDLVNNTLLCDCVPGFHGETCDQDKNECAMGTPCLNGVCHNSIGSYRCDCLPGWHGSHCRHKDPSSISCPSGYTGVNCTEDFDECTQWPESPCEHNNTCINIPGDFACSCSPGWKGRLCEEDVNECTQGPQNPCEHNGTCINTPGNFICTFTTGWEGRICNIPINTTASEFDPISSPSNEGKSIETLLWMILGLIGGLVVVTCIGTGTIIYTICIRHPYRGKIAAQRDKLRRV